jgi:single-strand DNA-binding protein
MFETNIVVVGNVLTTPEWRRTANTGALVATFRIASTARRMDRESGRWVDGDSLRLRVSCWRKLAEGVSASIMVGDPVVVMGRLFSRDWTDGEGNPRMSYEMEASAVGHDLSRGKAKFFRTRPQATDVATGPEAEAVVRGETADLVPAEEVPVGYGEGIPDVEEPVFDPLAELLSSATDPVADELSTAAGELGIEVAAADLEAAGASAAGAEAAGAEAAGAEPETGRRSRRPAKRQPVGV